MRKSPAIVMSFSAIVTALLLIVPLALVGCSGTSSSSKPTVNAQQFKLLQKARGTMIQQMSEVLNPSLTLAQRSEKVTAVLKKHQSELPDPARFPLQPNIQRKVADKQLQSTIVGQLMGLDRGPGSSGAAFVSQMYVRALGDLYGLAAFQKYLADHTVEEGAKINAANPPGQMAPNEQQHFGGSGLSANITFNPTTGDIKYILGEHTPDYRLSNATPTQIENQFVIDAKYWLTLGDDFLLDETRI
jgi:hypothetical protein